MKTEMHRNAQELDGMRNRSREASGCCRKRRQATAHSAAKGKKGSRAATW